MSNIEVSVYADDLQSTKHPKDSSANHQMQIYLTIKGQEHLLFVYVKDDGTTEVYWDHGMWVGPGGDPTKGQPS